MSWMVIILGSPFKFLRRNKAMYGLWYLALILSLILGRSSVGVLSSQATGRSEVFFWRRIKFSEISVASNLPTSWLWTSWESLRHQCWIWWCWFRTSTLSASLPPPPTPTHTHTPLYIYVRPRSKEDCPLFKRKDPPFQRVNE